MKINFLTLFPKYYDAFITESIIDKARQRNLIDFNVVDFRLFTKNKHLKVDDQVYGGGHGMLLQIEPIDLALDSLKNRGGYKILVSPQGKTFNQDIAQRLSELQEITFISGRYEGFDERIVELVDEEISIGDYVLTGGELPSMVMADSIIRLIPEVINEESYKNDSFQGEGWLDCPQYTRPAEYKGLKVPDVLLNGNHAKIAEWKKQAAIEKTLKNRPDIYEKIMKGKHEK